MQLTKALEIRRAADLSINISSHSTLSIRVGNKTVTGNRFTLAALDAFSTPTTLDQGIKTLHTRYPGVESWIELTQHIRYLFDQGILQAANGQSVKIKSHSGRFDAAQVHIRMLNDIERTKRYQQAIFNTVTATDIVLDIGTGTGVLATMAAKAGAKHVYAVEQSNLAGLAKEVFANNGFANKITLIEGKSTDIELPGKADILVSEIVGNDPLQENILPTTSDALSRLLKPGARLIPARLQIYALAISLPEKRYRKHIFTTEQAAHWQHQYDVDFSTLATAAQQQSHHLLVNTHDTRDWPRLSAPWRLADLDLATWNGGDITSESTITITQSGLLNGILIYFELSLDRNTTLSIHPDLAAATNSWASKVWIPGTTRKLNTGEQLRVTYRYQKDCSHFTIE